MARPDTSVRARLRQVQARSGAAVSLCDRLGGLEVRDTGAVLLFSSLVRSLKQRTRSLVHFYCGITEARGLPGYVYTSRWVSALQHCSTAAPCLPPVCRQDVQDGAAAAPGLRHRALRQAAARPGQLGRARAGGQRQAGN